jgi:hypothetical protein
MNYKPGDLVVVHWRKGWRQQGYGSECFKVGMVVGKSVMNTKWMVLLKWQIHGNYFDVYGMDESVLRKLEGWDEVVKIFKLAMMLSPSVRLDVECLMQVDVKGFLF